MKSRKKILSVIAAIGAAAAVAAGTTGCGAESSVKKAESTAGSTAGQTEKDLVKVRAAVMTNNVDQWLALIGKENGFFEKLGIQLEITEFAAGINTVDAIVTGQADIGLLADYAAVNRLGNTQKDTNLRFIARFGTGKGSSFYVNPEKVKKIEDLAGQGVITLPGTVWDYWTARTFEAANVPKDQQKILNVESAQAALGVMTSGEGIAVWAGGINGKKLEEAGMVPFLTMDDLGLRTDQYYISSTEFLGSQETVVEEFLAAIKETEEWLAAHGEEAAAILEEKVNIPKEQSLVNFKNYEFMIDFKEDTVEHLNGIKKWAVEEGRFEQDYAIKDYVDLRALTALYPDEVGIK